MAESNFQHNAREMFKARGWSVQKKTDRRYGDVTLFAFHPSKLIRVTIWAESIAFFEFPTIEHDHDGTARTRWSSFHVPDFQTHRGALPTIGDDELLKLAKEAKAEHEQRQQNTAILTARILRLRKAGAPMWKALIAIQDWAGTEALSDRCFFCHTEAHLQDCPLGLIEAAPGCRWGTGCRYHRILLSNIHSWLIRRKESRRSQEHRPGRS